MALLSIHDQGAGIPPDVRDKIFDLYFTTKKDGSGIGLAMTYRIVELHNGSIEVESDATHGTTFILRFPLNSLQESRERVDTLMPDGSSSAGSIVLRSPGDEGSQPMLVAGPARHFLYRVFAQRLATATSAGSAVADRKRDAAPADHDRSSRKNRNSAGFAFAAAIRAKRALASSATEEGEAQAQAARPSRQTRPDCGGLGGGLSSPASTDPRPLRRLLRKWPADWREQASPIGQLTTGDSAMGEKNQARDGGSDRRTEQGLNGIKRSLSTEEKVTAAQIRNYLKQAQQALDNGDTDGAHLLATKAKLLLDELTKPRVPANAAPALG
jgi:hypothetical protein